MQRPGGLPVGGAGNADGNGIALRLRWGFAAVAAVVFGVIVLLVLLLDELDGGLLAQGGLNSSASYGIPLVHTQLRPLPSGAAETSQGGSLQRTPSFFQPILHPAPAKSPLALILASRLGLDRDGASSIGGGSPEGPKSFVPTAPIRSEDLLPLHDTLNSTVDTRLYLSGATVVLAVVHSHTRPQSDESEHGQPFDGLIQLWSRSAEPLLPAQTPLWHNEQPNVLQEPWTLLLEHHVQGAVDRWDWDGDRRMIAMAHRVARSQRAVTLLVLDSSWSVVASESSFLLPHAQGRVSALCLTQSHVTFAMDEMTHSFEAISIVDSRLSAELSEDGGLASRPPEEPPVAWYQRVAALVRLPPNHQRNDRVLAVLYRSDLLRYYYSIRVYEEDFEGEAMWTLLTTVSGKSFAAADVLVRYPDPLPQSNLILTRPMEAPQVIGVSSTPFIMTIDPRIGFRNHQSIKIVNLDDRMQFTQMALDPKGRFMVLTDNTNGFVLLEKAIGHNSPLQWEVTMEFALPIYLRSLRILSIALVARPPLSSDKEDQGVLLVVLLEDGVIATFDISQLPQLDDMSQIFDWHLEILLGVISMLAYVILARLVRNNTGARPNQQQNFAMGANFPVAQQLQT